MGIFNGAGSRPGWEEKDAADFRRELIKAASASASIGLGQQFKHGDKVVRPPKQQMIIDAGEAFLAELHPGVKFNVFMAIDNPCDYYRLRYKRADGLALSSGERVGEIASWPTTATEAEIAGYLTAAMHAQMAKKQVGPERTEQPEDGNSLATYEGGGDW